MSASGPGRGKSPIQLTDLTLAKGDVSTLRTVLGRYLNHQMQAFLSLPMRLIEPDNRALYSNVAGWMQRLVRNNRGQALATLRPPTQNGLIAPISRAACPDGDHAALNRWLRELCLLLLLELAMRGQLPEAGIDWQAQGKVPPTLRSIAANLLLRFERPIDSLHFSAGVLEVRTVDGNWQVPLLPDADLTADEAPFSFERPYHRIVPGVSLALTDNNPLSDFEAHPDKDGNQLDLGDCPVQQWVDSLRGCFELVDRYLPLLGEELRMVASLVVPVGFEAEKHLSASYKEVIGTAYMTLHPNPMTMAEALVHEFQHNKINAAFHLDPLLRNGFWPLYISPVRPDPRPLHGVILAVHAFQPVAALYRAMANADDPMASNPSWRKRFADIVAKNHSGATTVLDHAEPTQVGRGLFEEMRALDEAASGWV